RQFSLLRIKLALDHCHGRHRTYVMRKQTLEKSRADLRKIVVDFQVNARSQERKALQQAFHVRILTAIRLHQEPAGKLRILPSPLRSHLADVRQLAFVIIEKVFPDARHVNSPCIRHWLDRGNYGTPLPPEPDPS